MLLKGNFFKLFKKLHKYRWTKKSKLNILINIFQNIHEKFEILKQNESSILIIDVLFLL